MKPILLSLLAVPFFAVAVQAQDAKPEKPNKPKMDPAEAFKKMDTNADASVTLEEFKASPRWKKNADKADEAFKKLPPGTVENLLKPENKAQLVKILTYHVVPGKVMSSALAGKKTDAKTVQGEMVMVDATMGGVTVNGAKVVTADVVADNGVIHVIDTVLMPK